MSSSTPPATSQPQLNEHLQDLRRDVGTLAQDVKTHATAQLNDLKDEAASRLKETQKQATEQLSKAKENASRFLESSRSFLSEHPLTAIGVGVVLGMLLASRCRKAS